MENLAINFENKFDKVVVSSREIATNFSKRHDHVIRDIEKIIEGVTPNLGTPIIYQSTYIHESNKQEYKEYLLTKDGLTLYLFNIQGYNDFKMAYINRFNEMEKALNDIRFKIGDKKHQLECMELLNDMLPKDMKKDKVNYIKANTVVNKTVSNIYGFPKMLKKIEMNNQMLECRELVLNDYIKLFDVLNENGLVKDALYKKYTNKLLEG